MDETSVSDLPPVVMTREEARALGLRVFLSGKPCIRGHTSERYTSSGSCIACRDEGRKATDYEGARCLADGCGRRREQKGYCPKHYIMWKNHGDPLTPPSRVSGAALEWLEKHKDYDGEACLIWPFGSAGKHRSGAFGYGQATYKGKNINAHTLMCILAHGEKSEDKPVAAHLCGKGHTGCVAPNHLKWCTYAENTADRIEHGTAMRGMDSPNAKLTVYDVLMIRSLKGKVPVKKVAEDFGIGATQVKRIMDRESWSHID